MKKTPDFSPPPTPSLSIYISCCWSFINVTIEFDIHFALHCVFVPKAARFFSEIFFLYPILHNFTNVKNRRKVVEECKVPHYCGVVFS